MMSTLSLNRDKELRTAPNNFVTDAMGLDVVFR